MSPSISYQISCKGSAGVACRPHRVKGRHGPQRQRFHQRVRHQAGQDGHEAVAHEHRAAEGAAEPLAVVAALRACRAAARQPAL